MPQTYPGVAAGGLHCAFNYNTIGTKPYGDYPSDPTQMFGYFFVVTGSSGGGPAKVIDIIGNTMSAGNLRVGVFNNNIDAQNIRVMNNSASTAFVSETDINTVMTFDTVAGLTVTGNTQHVTSGTFESHSGCTGVTVSGNTT